jgi:hypothetical protein
MALMCTTLWYINTGGRGVGWTMANLGAKSGCTASTIMCRHIGSMEPNHIENPTRYPPILPRKIKQPRGSPDRLNTSRIQWHGLRLVSGKLVDTVRVRQRTMETVNISRHIVGNKLKLDEFVYYSVIALF